LWKPKEESKVCEEWQVGKQTKISEPKLQYQTTSKILERLLDLIRGTQNESTGVKRNTHVDVDDYSSFDEMNLARDMCLFEDICQIIQR
jgi:hypothetical protein